LGAYVNLKRAALVVAKLRNVRIPDGFNPNAPGMGTPAKMLLRRIADSPDPEPTFAARLLKIAHEQLGVKEHPAGSNDGEAVRQYQATTGAYHQPWCASFVTWCLERANYKGPWPTNKAYVPSWVAWAKANKLTVTRPRMGDLVCYDWEHNGVADHIGIVDVATAVGTTMYVIEGNTSTSSDSNGGEVMRRRRNFSQVAAFIRLTAPS